MMFLRHVLLALELVANEVADQCSDSNLDLLMWDLQLQQ